MKRALLALSVYCALTIALTFPLILQLGSVLPNDAGDPALNTWILWWNAHAVPYTSTWWNAPNFYPVAGALAFSENLLGLSLIGTPLQWLGASPQVAYNIILLLTFPLCAIGAYLLALEATRRHEAAFLAGLLYGFAPYRIAHLPQIQVLAAFGMPFALVGLHRYLRDSRRRWLVLFGASWFLQAICNGYYLLFFGVFVGLWILWFAPPWRTPKAFAAIMGAWLISSLPLAPLLYRYHEIHQRFAFTRGFGTIGFFGADVTALLDAVRHLWLWRRLHVFDRAEGELFPGLTLVAIIVAGMIAIQKTPVSISRSRPWMFARAALFMVGAIAALVTVSTHLVGPWRLKSHGWTLFSVANPVKPFTYVLAMAIILTLTCARVRAACSARSVLGFYAVAGFVMWLLSLGPTPSFLGEQVMYRGPYALLMLLPGFDALRVPARFWMLAVMCLSVASAVFFDRLTARLDRKRVAIAAIVALGVMADTWVSKFPLVKAPESWKAEACANNDATTARGALLELPVGESFADVAAMYRSMSHGRPVVNGYSGYFPPHYAALRFGVSFREDEMLTQLAAHGTSHIAVNEDHDPDGALRRYVSAHAGAELVCREGRRSLYRLTNTRASETYTLAFSLPIRAVRSNTNPEKVDNMTDGDLETRWESGPQTEGTWIVIDLGESPRVVNTLELKLGPFFEDFPRALAIEASSDAQSWREVWRGPSAARAFVAAFETPREVPVRFQVAPTPARYLRLMLLSNDEIYYWSIAELKVLGS